MAQNLKVGESGKIFRVASGFDMSSNTELTLTFYKPTEDAVTKVKADGVTLGTGVTDPDLGILAADEYVDYDIEPLLLTEAGTWQVTLTYDDTVPAPDDHFIGNCASFTVDDAVCS